MGTILEFKRPDGSEMHESLNLLVDSLETLYTVIEQAEHSLEIAYEECSRTEEDYNKVLGKYATLVGDDNIEDKYLNYCSEVEIFFIPETEEIYAKYTSPKQLNLFNEEDLEQ